jgi:hypothetical protein
VDKFAGTIEHAHDVTSDTPAGCVAVVAVGPRDLSALLTPRKALYIDCGEKDQFNLLYGARRFVRRFQ